VFELPPPKDDGLYIPSVKAQSADKHYFLTRYIDAFTTSMKDKWELHYIDLFAGAGIERLEESGQLAWGSPMIAAQAPKPFHRLHLCELDPRKHAALTTRVTAFHPTAQILNGDANVKVPEILLEIPAKDALSLAFLDPYGLHLAFSTLQHLSAKRADLIIFFPDRLDILRNWNAYYYENQDSNLDRFLGPDSNWRSVLDEAPRASRAEVLRDLYISQLRQKLGYSEFDFERISAQGHPLYYLVFCSRHKLAATLWREITRKKPDGQRTFNFDLEDRQHC
jgi:three-Cys-motif partner protein